jgi:8-oxo-dGTP pyrophosphatase MutT (NUDIX family)
MSFLDRIAACAVFDPAAYLPFLVDGQHVGLVRPEFAARLAPYDTVFQVSASAVHLAAEPAGVDERTRAVDHVLRRLADEGALSGWRGESYAVAPRLEAPTLFYMERAAIPQFGVWASGVHVNGFVRQGAELSMWIGRRSPDKQAAPNKFDQIVAGGRSAGYSVRETMIKESEEEASIDADLASRAIPVGAITYRTEREEGLRRDVIYVYDLELPADFIPHNTDGEIAEFELWPIARVMERVRDSDDFKFNCSLVVVDFLIRHGVVTPDDEPDYLALIEGLRAR